MWKPDISIDMDQITVENYVLKRPINVGRSAWFDYWEQVFNPIPVSDDDGCCSVCGSSLSE